MLHEVLMYTNYYIALYKWLQYKKTERKRNNMDVDYKALGKRIKIARINKDITQEVVAEKIDITASHMSNIETGKTKVSLPVLINIANALSVTVDELLCDNVLNSKIIFEGEAKEIFNDCDEYEVRMLVDVLKYMKEAIRKDREIRNKFGM